MKKLKIALFPLSSFISHVTRCLSIADELSKRGHQVEFVSSEKNSLLIKSNGYKTHIIRQLRHDQIVVTGAPLSYLERYQKNTAHCSHSSKFGLREMAADDLYILQKIRPDLVVCDSCPTSYLSATALGIPCVMIKNTLGYIDSSLSDAVKKEGLDLSDELDFSIEKKMSLEFHSDCLKLNNAFIARQKTIPFIIPGSPQIEQIDNINIFERLVHKFVGNFEWNGWSNKQMPNAEKYKGKTLILVTMGSSFPFASLIKNVLKAFPEKRFHIVINTGSQVDIPENIDGRKNYEVHPYLCLEAFLKIADVLICHGGHGTVMSAFKSGTPVLAIPFNGDQMIISKQLETLNCGLRIKKYPDDITASELRRAIDSLLTNKAFAENAGFYGETLRAMGNGAVNAADYIEEFYDLRQWENEVSVGLSNKSTAVEIEENKAHFKILFAVEDNRAHVLDSCLAMAFELKKKGGQIALLVSSKSTSMIESLGFKAFISDSIPKEWLEAIDIYEGYFNTTSLADVSPGKINRVLGDIVAADLGIYLDYNPDIIVDAGRISTAIAAGYAGIKTIRFHTFSSGSSLQTIQKLSSGPKKSILEKFRESIGQIKKEYPASAAIESEQESTLTSTVLCPSIPSLEPELQKSGSKHSSQVHLGYISDKHLNPNAAVPDSLYMDTYLILLLLPDTQLYQKIRSAIFAIHLDIKFRIITADNISEYLKVSDLVIHTGNYAHSLCALKHRIPALTVPYYQDEFLFAQWMAKEGWAEVIKEHPQHIKSETIKQTIDSLRKNQSPIQEKMIPVSGELALWNEGQSRAAYIIQDNLKLTKEN